MSGWYGVDLDGTLAHYESGDIDRFGRYHIGDPIEPMVEYVKSYLDSGREVRIFTARMTHNDPNITTFIENWCELHLGQKLKVTNVKDYHMIELWDDRAKQVRQNTGLFEIDCVIADFDEKSRDSAWERDLYD